MPGRQGRALFGYLAARPDRAASRDEIANALWPEELPSAPDLAISALLSKLRRLLGDEALRGRSEVSLELPPRSWVDLECARVDIHQAESMVIAERWLDGFVPASTARFISERPFMRGEAAPWTEDVRRELEEIHIRALECTVAVSLGLGGAEAPVALSSARRLVELAPYRESGYRWLMRALEHEGNAAEALRVYDEPSRHADAGSRLRACRRDAGSPRAPSRGHLSALPVLRGLAALGFPQALDEHLEHRPRHVRVLLHERAELERGQRPAAQLLGRRDRCGAGALRDQGQLAEPVARPERVDRPRRPASRSPSPNRSGRRSRVPCDPRRRSPCRRRTRAPGASSGAASAPCRRGS